MALSDLSESLSRFILSKKYYSIEKKIVKYAAFLPNNNGETSVFRTSGIPDKEIWDIGDREVSTIRQKPILGRADIIAYLVLKKGLEVIPSEPPERHANIAGWPDERSKQRLIALELAAESQLHLR